MSIVFFLLLDVVPDYIQKTFNLTPKGRFVNDPDGLYMRTVFEGERIPDNLDFAVILYNDHAYHGGAAAQLSAQITSLNPGAKVLMLPVQG